MMTAAGRVACQHRLCQLSQEVACGLEALLPEMMRRSSFGHPWMLEHRRKARALSRQHLLLRALQVPNPPFLQKNSFYG